MIITINNNLTFHEYHNSKILTVYKIRNSKTVRKYLNEDKTISYKDHKSWINNNINKLKRVRLFIIYYKKNPIGLSIIKKNNKQELEVELIFKEPKNYPFICGLSIIANCEIVFNILKYNFFFSQINKNNKIPLSFHNKLNFIKIASTKNNFLKFYANKNILYKNKTYIKILGRIKLSLSK